MNSETRCKVLQLGENIKFDNVIWIFVSMLLMMTMCTYTAVRSSTYATRVRYLTTIYLALLRWPFKAYMRTIMWSGNLQVQKGDVDRNDAL